MRKVALAQLLSEPIDGIFIAEYERGDIGDVLFRVACNMGLEGIVSKHLDRSYGAGKCRHWVKASANSFGGRFARPVSLAVCEIGTDGLRRLVVADFCRSEIGSWLEAIG
jgi:hypothetical protein